MKGHPRLTPDLIWRLLDDNAVVVSPVSGKVRVFNGIGTVIWTMLAEEKPIDEIERHIVAHYSVSPEQVRTDIQDFLSELERRGLLVWDKNQPPS